MSSVTEPVADKSMSVDQEEPSLRAALPFSVPGAICIALGYAPLIFMHLWGLWSKETPWGEDGYLSAYAFL